MAIDEKWQRLGLILGEDKIQRLNESVVLIVGVGGVGAMSVEALARSGIGTLILVDNDEVEKTNINRQILALNTNIHQSKVEVMKKRILEINPDCNVITYHEFYSKDNIRIFDHPIDFVIDAIDTVTCKVDLIEESQKRNIPVISCLGMGNRMDPSQLRYTTLDKTSYDPLARALRQIMRKRGLDLKVPVVISLETPIVQNIIVNQEGETQKEKTPPSSSAFVPNAAGLLLASYVVKKLTE